MILADSSIWIEHLRDPIPLMSEQLAARNVVMHPMIIGELACGNIYNRAVQLADWRKYPKVEEVSHEEALDFIEERRLMGRGIDWVDVHLLCAALRRDDVLLWTRDLRLQVAAGECGVAFTSTP